MDETAASRCILVISGVDEVSTGLVEGVQQLEAALLVHSSHAHLALVPLVADVHGTELDGRDMNTRVGSQLAVVAKLSLGLGRGFHEGGHDGILLEDLEANQTAAEAARAVGR